MDKIIINGGRRLEGEVFVSGSKNAALPILISSLLTPEPCVYQRVPNLLDIHTTLKLLAGLGVAVDKQAWLTGSGDLVLRAQRVENFEASYDLVKTMRASFLVLGPLLARFGHARVSTPGGCAIGTRPVNLHLKGLAEMGATILQIHGYVEAKAEKLRGARIYLDLPSVGATENLMMAATLAEGTTVIENAAKEPEIEDLARVLNLMGGKIVGAGSDIIRIDGVSSLTGVTHRVIPDRIEAASFIIAGALTGGEVVVKDARSEHLDAFLIKLKEAGVSITPDGGAIRITGNGRIKSVDVTTLPYPGFPTDLQAQMMVLMAVADGVSVITETIFENRFMHAQELDRMGADIRLEGNRAVVRGVKELSGAPVMATDLRASVSLILAGLVANGKTEVSRVYHLDRGYEHIEKKLLALGAAIQRVQG
ncbi:MAG TPA: UDP-N-acetylglucosamine 1-carboxyvinyltransferase [Candidatus Binatia bacterium]|nr:UDP-N-acetylglucosamine 1-carboxyvinyltransferase [Candidatus Binatia bacterium]